MITSLFALWLAAPPPAAPPLAITNVQVEVGDGTVLPAATVVVAGGTIKSVGAAAPPAGATVVDGAGRVLAPGFVEVLTQLGLVEVSLEASTHDDSAGEGRITPAFRAGDGFNPLSVRIPISREEGVLTALTSPRGVLLFGTGGFWDLRGSLDARPDPAAPAAMFGAIHLPGGAGFASHGEQWLRLREIFADARFYLQNKANFDRGQSRDLSLSPLHLEALAPVLDRRIPLVLEVQRSSDILTALSFAAEQKIRLVLAGGAEAWRVAAAIKAAGVPVILRPTGQMPGSFDMLAARDDAARVLHEAGVTLVLSTIDGDNNIRRLRQEAGRAVAYGMPHAAALRAISLTPAEVFGRGAQLGSVAAGKAANLVLWSGDPLEVTSVAERLWIAGVETSLDNRQRQLAARYLTTITVPVQPPAVAP